MGRQKHNLMTSVFGENIKTPSRPGFGNLYGFYFHFPELTFYLEISALPVVQRSVLSPCGGGKGLGPLLARTPLASAWSLLDVGLYPGCLLTFSGLL